MKSKKDVGRNDLKQNMMKKVIFRIDYHGIIETEDVIKEFKSEFKDKFGSFVTTFHNKVDLVIDNIEEMSDTLSVPIKEIERQEIFRFTNNKFGNDIVTFDVSKYYTSLTVDCKNYTNIDEYLDFFSDYTEFLYGKNEYLVIKRLGIRKIGGLLYFDLNNIFKDFEKKYFDFGFEEEKYTSLRSRYYDALHGKENDPLVNYTRTFESGKYYDQEKGTEEDAYQVLLDLDCYYREGELTNIGFGIGKVNNILSLTNDELFDLFKMSVTEDYLNRQMS